MTAPQSRQIPSCLEQMDQTNINWLLVFSNLHCIGFTIINSPTNPQQHTIIYLRTNPYQNKTNITWVPYLSAVKWESENVVQKQRTDDVVAAYDEEIKAVMWGVCKPAVHMVFCISICDCICICFCICICIFDSQFAIYISRSCKL